jgi:nucleotide sugar dehydrogenase
MDTETRIVACIGPGSVDLRTAVSFCNSGYDVVGVDIDDKRVEQIQKGTTETNSNAFVEQIRTHLEAGNFRVTTSLDAETADSQSHLISVPTPASSNGESVFSAVRTIGREISTVLDDGDLIMLQSTVPPGTCRNVLISELERSGLHAGTDFNLAHVPERYSPGNEESLTTPRLVSGVTSDCLEAALDLYRSAETTLVPVESMETAASAKLFENIQRDVNIALINQLARAFGGIDTFIHRVLDAADTNWNFHRYDPVHSLADCVPGAGDHLEPTQ